MKNTKGYCANNDRYGNVRSWTGGELGARVETSALACAVIACELDESERARIYLQDMRTSKHTLGSMVTAGRVLGGGYGNGQVYGDADCGDSTGSTVGKGGTFPTTSQSQHFPTHH